jgi:hypothetical protein
VRGTTYGAGGGGGADACGQGEPGGMTVDWIRLDWKLGVRDVCIFFFGGLGYICVWAEDKRTTISLMLGRNTEYQPSIDKVVLILSHSNLCLFIINSDFKTKQAQAK